MMMKEVYNNTALIATFILSQIPFAFKGQTFRVDWYLFIEHTKRIDYAILFYAYSINFIILSYILHYKKKVDKRLTRLILTITVLDLIHLLLIAKQGFGMAKIGIAVLIVLSYDLYKKNASN